MEINCYASLEPIPQVSSPWLLAVLSPPAQSGILSLQDWTASALPSYGEAINKVFEGS